MLFKNDQTTVCVRIHHLQPQPLHFHSHHLQSPNFEIFNFSLTSSSSFIEFNWTQNKFLVQSEPLGVDFEVHHRLHHCGLYGDHHLHLLLHFQLLTEIRKFHFFEVIIVLMTYVYLVQITTPKYAFKYQNEWCKYQHGQTSRWNYVIYPFIK